MLKEWKNLNFSCEICNGKSYKSDKWDYDNSILDPTKDELGKYLELDLDTAHIIPINDDARAITTINHTGLNRDKLVQRRGKIIVLLRSLLINTKNTDINEFIDFIEVYIDTHGYQLTCTSFLNAVKSIRII